mgnify:CR=1 FL=1
MMEFKSKFILLRHSQPKPFPGPWIQPNSNPLSDSGVKQANDISSVLKEKSIDLIYSSPYTRAKQTAKIIGNNLGLKVTVEEYLKERQQGDLENQKLPADKINLLWEKFKEFKTLTPKEQWSVKPFPKFETDQELLERTLNCLNKISNTNPEKTMLIVTHASLIKTLLIHLGKVNLDDRENFNVKINEVIEI